MNGPSSPLQTLAAAVAVFLVLAFAPGARAQGGGAEAANQAAYEIFLTGDYEKAAEAYAKVLQDYPTSTIVPAAQLQLAFSLFFLGKQDEALAALQQLYSGPPPPDAINQAARNLEPQILSAKALALEPGDAARKTTFQQAVKKFDEFISQFPNFPDLEQAIYGRAFANFQIAEYDAAITDLEASVARFANSSTIPSSQNLLALAYATKGSLELTENEQPDRDAAFALYDKSVEILRDIINSRVDLTLVNDANFQLGEILFNKAAFSDEEDRPEIYAESLAAYRSILPKDAVVDLQRRRIESFPELRRQAIAARDRLALERLGKENERELRRLAELQSRPDQIPPAMLKMAEIFLNLNQINASRVLLTHLGPFIDDADRQKRIAYLTAMTYALQNASTQAVGAYDAFQAEHKGDAVAVTLPFAMGNLFLNHPDPAVNNPATAVQYFQESLDLYPDGPVASLSAISQAAALSRLGQAEQAEKTFVDFLASNPRPAEAVVAQMGLASLLKDTGRHDEAITAFSELREKFPGQPQADEAQFWIAVSTQQKGDHAAAVSRFQEFVESQPGSPLVPSALFGKAASQLATNDRESGLATLAAVAEQFPDSREATFTYFQRGQILAADGRADEMLALMREFIEKYPADDKVYFAYDSLGQAALNAADLDTAVETYQTYVTSYPDTPQASEALQKLADIRRHAAEMLGRYSAMPAEDREIWQGHIDASIAAAEQLFRTYPDSPQVAFALRGLLAAQRLLSTAELKSPGDIQAYFNALAEEAPSPAARSKALFTLASFLSESDPAKSLETMDSAYDASVVFTPGDLDIYALALIENDQLDKASEVFDKLAADYPNPPNVGPTQAPPQIQEAQAVVLFGRGRIAQERGQRAEAAESFEKLRELYPWSPKVLEANFGIAQSLLEQKKYDEAVALLGGIIRATTAPAELRADSMLLGGDIMAEKGETEAAIDYYIKIAQFYSGVPAAAAEGLWRGGQLLEKQAASLSGAERDRQINVARRAYQDLVNDFPNSPHARAAQERLSALGQ